MNPEEEPQDEEDKPLLSLAFWGALGFGLVCVVLALALFLWAAGASPRRGPPARLSADPPPARGARVGMDETAVKR